MSDLLSASSLRCRSTLGVQTVLTAHRLCSVHSPGLLRWRVLDVAHLDEGEETIQVPELTLEGDVERNHPIIDQLGCDHVSARPLISVVEPSRGLPRVDVLV